MMKRYMFLFGAIRIAQREQGFNGDPIQKTHVCDLESDEEAALLIEEFLTHLEVHNVERGRLAGVQRRTSSYE